MRRKFICLVALVSVFAMAVFAGGAKDPVEAFNLDGTVWAGPLGGDDWITVAFRPSDGSRGPDAVIQSASPVNGDTAHAEYAYDGKTRTGSISSGGPGNPPGAFSLVDANKTIVFSNFKRSGSPLVLKRLLPDAENTFALIDPLPSDLKNTVWVSEGFRVNDWITLTFKGLDGESGSVEFAHVADSSQNTRTYAYDDAQKTGAISYVARDFEISDNNAKLQIRGFYGHGIPVDFKRVR